MLSNPSHEAAQETRLSLLRGAQTFLKALLEHRAPDSLVVVAWDDFYRVYDDLIHRFVVAQGLPHSDVEDCVQEVWSEVAVRLMDFDRPADRPGLRAWLYTLVRSKATNVYRKRARQSVESLDEKRSSGEEPGDTQADPAALYERQWEQAVLDNMIAQLRAELSATNSQILQMRLIDRRSVEEVAGELKLTPEQVYARQHRILKELRNRVACYTGGPLDTEGPEP